MAASNKMNDYAKRCLVTKVVELYFSESLNQLFEEEIRKTWNDYVKSLAPAASEKKLFISSAYVYPDFRDKDETNRVFIKDCIEAFLPCTEKLGCSDTFNINMSKCPDPKFAMAVSMYQEHKQKKNEFEILLMSRLVSINTEAQLKEQMPKIAQYLDSETTTQNLPVAIDMEAIEVSFEESA